jgi:DNA-binding HxlR family transcriptional regulator
MPQTVKFTEAQIAKAKTYAPPSARQPIDPRVECLVHDLIGRVADKWTMLILDVLAEEGELRFTRLGELVPGISQKMLTQTLRLMERYGLVTRTVHAVVPPKVEYRLTALGLSLGAAFCGVWVWAEENLKEVDEARAVFDERSVRG